MSNFRTTLILLLGATLVFGNVSQGLASPADQSIPAPAITAAPAASPQPLAGRTILIDPGHGGKDPGAARAGVEEKNITLAVSLLLRDKLESLGAKVDLTRDADVAVSLPERLTDSNTSCPDIFLSIHVNSVRLSRVAGIETYYYDGRGRLLASMVLDTLAFQLRTPAKWSHARDLHVLVGNRVPATLAEIGYLTNPPSRALLRTPAYQERVAVSLADSLLDYFAAPGVPHGCQA
jgi:N-acetylmuramoyl-L-alanine amidase